MKTNYVVTNLCKGCVGCSCSMNCPKDAITFMENGQAHIDHSKCINCGISKDAYPYHSIVYIPVPCEGGCISDPCGKIDYAQSQKIFRKQMGE